jgi:hypothetical protein
LVVLFTLTESLIVHAANGNLREGERRGGEGRKRKIKTKKKR